jgi:hypothetical protein
MPRKHRQPEAELFQFAPNAFDVSYDFGASALEAKQTLSQATQSVELDGPITYSKDPGHAHFELCVYAGSDTLEERRNSGSSHIGSADARRGRLTGSLWVPDEHFGALVVMALSGRLRSVSVMARKSSHVRSAWLVINFSISTKAEN